MGFRERPEYQEWREAVFRLFGRKCIRCGYAGNIHAHHLMPVEDYPELAFEPTNGVPLCGNCHTELKGNELAHVDDLKRLQRVVLGGEAAGVATDEPSEPQLRERAYAEPSNPDAVKKWFDATSDSEAVVEFCEKHPAEVKTRPFVRFGLLRHLVELRRWKDVSTEAGEQLDVALGAHDELMRRRDRDVLIRLAGGEPGKTTAGLERIATELASFKATALCQLGRPSDSAGFLREMIGRFPEVAKLHYKLSSALFDVFDHARKNGEQPPAAALDESLRHTFKAVELAPDEYSHVFQASFLLQAKGNHVSALHYSKRALALASTDEDKIDALQAIARFYQANDLYADARSYLREAMQIDDCALDVIGGLAHCLLMEGKNREALWIARHGLLLDPDDETCQRICKMVGSAID